jgi:hypothetical protein
LYDFLCEQAGDLGYHRLVDVVPLGDEPLLPLVAAAMTKDFLKVAPVIPCAGPRSFQLTSLSR